MAAVVFDYASWAARYPALAAVTSQATAEAMFSDATLTLLGNDGPDEPASIVQNEPRRLQLLNMLVAHLAALEQRNATGGGAGMVGNINNASEGSVSIGLTPLSSTSETAAWYRQTQYGAQYWTAIQPYMRATYLKGPRVFVDVGNRRRFPPGY